MACGGPLAEDVDGPVYYETNAFIVNRDTLTAAWYQLVVVAHS